MGFIKECTKEFFERNWPGVYICNSHEVDHYLPNGDYLLASEWNGERYTTNRAQYVPKYDQVGEDDFMLVGFYMI